MKNSAAITTNRLHPDRSARRLIKRLEQIGFYVSVQQAAAEVSTPPSSTIATRIENRPHSGPPPKSKPTASAAEHADKPKPADPTVCRRCAHWGIPCIHARNAKPRSSLVRRRPAINDLHSVFEGIQETFVN